MNKTGDKGSSMEAFQFHVEAALLTVFFLAGLVANIPLSIIYIKSKHIRSITDKFLFNLLIADVISVSILLPTILLDFLQYEQSSFSLLVPTTTSSLPFSTTSYPSTYTNYNESNENIVGEAEQERYSDFGLLHPDANAQEVPLEGFHSSQTPSPHQIHILVQFDNWSCMFKNGLLSAIATASVLAALEIAVERYLAVCTPLHYHKLLTHPTIFLTSLVATFISLVSGLVSAFDPSPSLFPSCNASRRRSRLQYLTKRSQEDGLHGEYNESEELWWSTYNLAHLFIFFIFPVLLMTYIYISIWLEARRSKVRMNQRYKPFYLTVPDKLEDDIKGKSRFHPVVIRFKLMHRLKATRFDRAARVAIFTLVVTTLCWTPYYFVKASHAIQSIFRLYQDAVEEVPVFSSAEKEISYMSWETVIPLLLTSLHPILAPVFYAYRYKRLREGMLRVGMSQPYCCSSCNCKDCDKAEAIERQAPGEKCKSLSGTQLISPLHQTGDLLSKRSIENGVPHDKNVSSETMQTPAPTYTSPNSTGSNADGNGVANSNSLATCNSHVGIEIHVVSEDGLIIAPENNPGANNNGLVESGNCCLSLENISNAKNGGLNGEADYGRAVASPSSLVNCLTLWMGSYSRRWNSHRESVTSTASFITLLSTRSNNKIHPIANV